MASPQAGSKLPLLAALTSVVLWAAAFVGIRAAGRSYSPGALALGRLTIGTILLGALTLTRPRIRPTARELALLLLAGVTWFGIYSVVLNEAERRVDAGTAAMLVLVAPIIVITLAAAFLKERTTPNLLLGAGIAFGGVVVIGLASAGGATLAGVALCLTAAVSSSVGLVAEKPALRRLTALQATWTCCAVGALSCLPWAPVLLREVRVAAASDTLWLVFLGVFPTSIAFTTWAYALARGTAGRVAATAYLVPPLTIVLSSLILDEVPRLVAVLGGALCLVGVYIARKTPASVVAASVVNAEEVRAERR